MKYKFNVGDLVRILTKNSHKHIHECAYRVTRVIEKCGMRRMPGFSMKRLFDNTQNIHYQDTPCVRHLTKEEENDLIVMGYEIDEF